MADFPLLFCVALIIILFVWIKWRRFINPKRKAPTLKFPDVWRKILEENVFFYTALTREEKKRFEYDIQSFLLNCKVTGVGTEVGELEELLVASSAVIPVFGFEDWEYTTIHEVLIYPDSFNDNFQFLGENRNVLGMVGNRSMEGLMILSKKALILGFQNESDKKNTAIHEFVHLIDKEDGLIDGIPSLLLEKQYAIPWINLLSEEIEKIYAKKSDINPYGGTNRAEFFSVISEYFFERPQLLKKKHPELYRLLALIFKQQMAERKPKNQ